MADHISLDPTTLMTHGNSLGRVGKRIEEFAQQMVDRMSGYDPMDGDDTGEAIGQQYFDSAQSLLDASALAGGLLVDMSDLVVTVVELGEVTEAKLTRLNEDLANYDPKILGLPGGGSGSSSSSPSPGVRH